MAAQPGPGVVEIMIRQEHLIAVGTDHPGRGCEVGGRIVPGIEILAAVHPPQQLFPVPGLLLVEGTVLLQLVQKFHESTFLSGVEWLL